MTTADRAAFLAMIAERPHDSTTRFVFADWLQEHGDEAGEFEQRREGHLCRIRAEPDDDGPRLEYADWLESRKTCPECGGKGRVWSFMYGQPMPCDACDGTGRVSNGHGERAEFVRVQIELSRMDEAGEGEIDPVEGHTCWEYPCTTCAMVEKYRLLRLRERELFDVHRQGWMPRFACPTDGHLPFDVVERPVAEVNLRFRRGFAEACVTDWSRWRAFGEAILAHHDAVIGRVELTTAQPVRISGPHGGEHEEHGRWWIAGWQDLQGPTAVHAYEHGVDTSDDADESEIIRLALRDRFPGHCPNHPIEWVLPGERGHCPTCHGTGRVPNPDYGESQPCSTCDGTTQVPNGIGMARSVNLFRPSD